jgi:hypothetical protein
LEVKLEGLHVREERLTGACTESVVGTVAPLREAETVPLWFELTAPARAANVAVADPEGTVTEAGTVIGDVDVRATATPPVPAAPLRPTVHVLEPPEPIVAGEHARVLTATPVEATVIDPPVAVNAMLFEPGSAPNTLVRPNVATPTADVMVTETVATTPLATVASFIPHAMQL